MFSNALSRRTAVIAILFGLSATSALAQTADPPSSGTGESRPRRRGPPFEAIANDLGISVDRVRTAFQQVGRPPRGTDGPPSPDQLATYTQSLASAMDVPVAKLRAVLDKYRLPARQ